MDWSPLILSFQVASIATVIAAVVGIGIGALLVNPRVPGRDVVDVLVTTPMILPPTVLGYYVLVAVGRRSAIGTAFESLTGSPIVFTRTGAVLAATLGALPLVVKSARAALESVDPVLVQVARTLGAGTARSFLAVRLPLASGGIIAGLMLAFARSLGDFGVTLMIAGDIPGETQTASLAIFGAIQGNREQDALGMIAVLSMVAVVTLYTTNKLAAKRRVG